uniref:LRRCT domain-containing protein n=1 Tax=Tetraodon nigroviridis TaxID=99883 RepID=H3C5B1_TETNG
GCHGDRDKDHRPRQNCTAGGFSRVPAGLDPSTEVLLFPHNLFSGLAWSSFQPFAQLYEVDLTANQVSALPDGSFSACPALTELYLDNNAIGSLANHTFSGLALLKLLDLSSNRIQVLPPVLLHPLASLDTLILENNQVQAVPDDWFGPKEEVPYLLLAANPWACGCALRYLKAYLAEYGDNVYVRAGPTYTNNPDSVVSLLPLQPRP